MFLHLYYIKIMPERKFVTKQLSDKILDSFHSLQIYTKNFAFLAIRQEETPSPWSALRERKYFNLLSHVFWASAIYKPTLITSSLLHKNYLLDLGSHFKQSSQ